jgi:hypothetical protein
VPGELRHRCTINIFGANRRVSRKEAAVREHDALLQLGACFANELIRRVHGLVRADVVRASTNDTGDSSPC